jgi:hypothetical protein
MKPVAADFKPAAVPSWPLWSLAAACVVAACASGLWARHHRHELQALQTELQRSMAQQAAQALPAPPDPVGPKPYDRSLREMLTERASPWPDALASLEALAWQGVTPRALELNAADGAIRVELTVTEPARLLKFLDALNAGADKNANDLVWNLQQTQSEGASNMSVATLVGRKTPRAIAQ